MADRQTIDVRDCPECDNGTKGNYDRRVLLGGRGIFTCPVCGTRWQNADEKPTTKGIPIRWPSGGGSDGMPMADPGIEVGGTTHKPGGESGG